MRIFLFTILFLISSTLFSQSFTPEKYIERYAALAQKEMEIYKIPASITLAQGILESGAGGSFLAQKANNHFGVKCGGNWKGKTFKKNDDKRKECFRKYDDVEDSFRDHSEFISKSSRYAFLFEYNIQDYESWAKGLKKAGYATNPKYPKLLIDLIEKYDLSQYDGKVKATVIKSPKPKKKKSKKVKKTPTSTDASKVYIVKKGDTLYSIAKKHKSTVAEIQQANNKKGTSLSIGEQLLIP